MRLGGFLETLYEGPPLELMNPGASEFLTLAGHGLRLRRMGKADMIEVLRVLPMPLWDLLDDWFDDVPLKGALAATGLANLFQGPRSAGTGFTLLHHLVGRTGFGARRFPRSAAEHLVSAEQPEAVTAEIRLFLA
jgi:hypothetical protein